MSAAFVPEDEDARKRIRESLDETLFVEAGAGTGKTTSLVDRVMKLAASGRTTLDKVAVITFTDAAAAELRDRIRGSLEKAASDGTLNDDERLRCQRALADLDRSSIQTLHSFAGSILRERPLEAGLPPIFETMDAIQSDLAFDEAWTEWIDRKLDEPEHESDLYPALSLGLTIVRLTDRSRWNSTGTTTCLRGRHSPIFPSLPIRQCNSWWMRRRGVGEAVPVFETGRNGHAVQPHPTSFCWL